MAASSRRTTPTPTPNASTPVGSDTSGRRNEAQKQRRAGGALESIWHLPSWLSSLEGPRKLAINGLVIVVTALGSCVVLKDALKQVTIIDTIGVPKDLEADGYTSATMAQRIIDAVTRINRDAAMTRRIGIYTLSELDPLEPNSADYESPGRAHSSNSVSTFTLTSDDPSRKYDVSVGGVSLTTVILHLRELFGVSDTRITGEITAEQTVGVGGKDQKLPSKKFSIRLRIIDKAHIQYEAEATDKLETLVEQAALKLVERFEPLDAAYYSYYKRDYDNALRIVRTYLADQSTRKEEHWALNLLGLVEHGRYGHDEARAEKGYDEAIDVFAKLRTSAPKFAPAAYNLGLVLIDKGQKHLKDPDGEVARAQFSKAYKVAREGIAIEEAADNTRRERAVGYTTAGRALRFLAQWEAASYDDALRYFDRSIEADPTFIYAYFSQGAIHNERNAPYNAIAKYQLATEFNPSAQIFTRAGAYLRKYEQHADSVLMFQKAADLRPSGNAYAYWGMALRDSGRPEEARAIFERGTETDPTSPNSYNQLGLMYLGEKKWDEAADKFTRAITASPQWSNYYYNLGCALRGAGKFEQAIATFKKSIDIYKSHVGSREELDATLLDLDLREKGTVLGETACPDHQRELKPAI
jgi:tetratricopeptide (TPR) repeat protein